MPDTSITQLQQYTPTAYDTLADHRADVFVIVDTRDHTMSNFGSDKYLTVGQIVSASGILDIAFAPVAQGNLIYRDSTAWAILAPGTSGYILASQGASANPQWIANTVGTVTSVTFTGDGTVLSTTPSSAVTSSGTVTASLNTQTANRVFSGPTTGSAAVPTFRALVADDIPPYALQFLTWTVPIGVLVGDQVGTNLNLNCSGGSAFLVELGSGATPIITIQNMVVGQTVKVTLQQPASGSVGNPSWATSSQTIRWAGGSAPVLSGLGKADTVVFYGLTSTDLAAAMAMANF